MEKDEIEEIKEMMKKGKKVEGIDIGKKKIGIEV